MKPILALALLLLASPVAAQQIDSYVGKYYNVGATLPIQTTDPFQAAAAVCNQPPIVAPVTVNPSRFVWTDPALPSRVCLYTVPATGTLVSLPVPGSYEGTLTAINAVGSAESVRAPFSRLGTPAAPIGVQLVR